jgi:hypothetical protein
MSSSQHQNSDEPSGLLRTVVAVFSGVLFGVFLSKLRTPIKKSGKSEPPQEYTGEERSDRPFQPPIVTKIAPAPPQQNEANGTKDDTPPWKKIAERSIAVATVGLLVINIFVFCATKKAADAARDSANTAGESLHSVERAYMVFRTVNIIGGTENRPTGELRFWNIYGIWENVGATTARHVYQHIGSQAIPNEPDEKTFFGAGFNPGYRSIYIGPKSVQPTGAVRKPFDFVPTEQTPRTEGRFVWGWIAYKDVFPNTPIHVTEFCQGLDSVILNPDKSPKGFNFTPCQNHNCTDEDCENYKAVVAVIPP